MSVLATLFLSFVVVALAVTAMAIARDLGLEWRNGLERRQLNVHVGCADLPAALGGLGDEPHAVRFVFV